MRFLHVKHPSCAWFRQAPSNGIEEKLEGELSAPRIQSSAGGAERAGPSGLRLAGAVGLRSCVSRTLSQSHPQLGTILGKGTIPVEDSS